MQGAKTTYGDARVLALRLVQVPMWRGWAALPLPHRAEAVETYDHVLEYTEKLSCSIKTFDEMCSWAHYSPGVANGRALHPVQVQVLRLQAVGASVAHRRRRVAPEDGRRARRGPKG